MGGLDPVYSAEKIASDGKPSYATTTKYRHLIKKLITVVDNSPSEGRGTGMGYESSVDSRGILHPTNKVGQANADELIWMFGKDLEKFELNLSWGHYSKNGKWHRDAEMHTHPAAEILIFVGMDPDNIEYLGTEMEIGMGMECERHIFNTPTIAVCPSSFVHLPLINRWVDKPYGFIVYCLDGEHDSPWVDIHPDDI